MEIFKMLKRKDLNQEVLNAIFDKLRDCKTLFDCDEYIKDDCENCPIRKHRYNNQETDQSDLRKHFYKTLEKDLVSKLVTIQNEIKIAGEKIERNKTNPGVNAKIVSEMVESVNDSYGTDGMYLHKTYTMHEGKKCINIYRVIYSEQTQLFRVNLDNGKFKSMLKNYRQGGRISEAHFVKHFRNVDWFTI